MDARFIHNSPFGLYAVAVKVIKRTPKRVLCEATEHGTGPAGRQMQPGYQFYAPHNRVKLVLDYDKRIGVEE